MATIDSRTNPTFDPIAPEEHERGRPQTGIGPGLLAGVVMAAILCFLAAMRQQPFVEPFWVISSFLLGQDAMQGGAGPTILGIVIHFVMSAVLGGVFTVIFGRTTMRRMLGFGLFYGVFLWAVAQFIILPLLNPFVATRMGTVWTFFLAHLAYGLMLAACSPTVKDIDAPERGYIDPLRREVRP